MPSNTTVELWTLYACGVLITICRTYARISAVGYREFRADDYLIWLAIVRNHPLANFVKQSANTYPQLIYTAQTTLGYHVGIVAHGLANNGMTDAQRSALSHDDPEYVRRYANASYYAI